VGDLTEIEITQQIERRTDSAVRKGGGDGLVKKRRNQRDTFASRADGVGTKRGSGARKVQKAVGSLLAQKVERGEAVLEEADHGRAKSKERGHFLDLDGLEKGKISLRSYLEETSLKDVLVVGEKGIAERSQKAHGKNVPEGGGVSIKGNDNLLKTTSALSREKAQSYERGKRGRYGGLFEICRTLLSSLEKRN